MEMEMEMEMDLLSSLPPGFGFHPTDAELISYLRSKVLGLKLHDSRLLPIPHLDIYKHEPWDLPLRASSSSSSQWHFFTPRDKKYPNAAASRANRATPLGYWKSTGKDRNIKSTTNNRLIIGTKKTLVFHRGRPPSGTRTHWIMHEFYLHPNSLPPHAPAHLKDLFVLCRVTKRDPLDHQPPLPHEPADPPLPVPSDHHSGASTGALVPDDNTVADDLDNWLQELFDPNFAATSLLPPQSTASSSTPSAPAPKPDPTYYSPAQASEDETSFLLPEDIQTILGTHNHQNTQDLHFLEHQTTPSSSPFYCNDFDNRNENDDETGIVIRRRSITATYDNPDDSNIIKYNVKSKLQMHLYKKEDKTLQTANFVPNDGRVGEFDNSASVTGKDGNELKSTMPVRTKLRGFVHMDTLIFGALLVGGIAMLVYLVSNNRTIFS